MLENKHQTAGNRIMRFLGSPLAILLVLAAATMLRGFMLTEWSLWEDEETSIFFAQNLDKPFPRAFPVSFFSLNQLYEITGVEVAAGRALFAAIGVLSI